MSPIIPKIERIGVYGLTPEYEYKETSSGLRCLKLPSRDAFDLDLLEGYSGNNVHQPLKTFDDYKNRNKVVNTIKWMKNHRVQTDSVHFICGTGLLQRAAFMTFRPGVDHDHAGREWVAIKINELIAIWGTEGDNEGDGNRSQGTYAGIKFEELVTEKIQWRDKGSLYYNVMRATIGENQLIYSFQPDCVERRGA